MSRPRSPALLYRTSTGHLVQVDTEPVADARERVLYRALADRANTLADQADTDDKPTRAPIGFTTGDRP